MPYRLIAGESVQEGIRRVLSEQTERALNELADANLNRADTIHQVRKRCKKIRAALRLVRGDLGDAYSRENAWYRDAAQRISNARDAEAMIETLDSLAKHFPDRFDVELMLPLRKRLESRKNQLVDDTDRIDRLLQEFKSAMVEGNERLDRLCFESSGYEAALGGMCQSYARGRKAMKHALEDPTPETFHEWRKRVKYHGYHMRLLGEISPAVVKARRNEANKLGQLLGDHHNLSVLKAWLKHEREAPFEKEALKSVYKLVNKRAAQIERESKPMGRRLFAEIPKHLARRFAIYFKIWSETFSTK
jgi:CHAD domain-containing protein